VAALNRGDLAWIEFNPQTGHAQAGRRPAIVLSPRSHHQSTRHVIVCPITSRVKGDPYEVRRPDGLAVSGAVLPDQGKNLDRRVRRIEYAGHAPASVVDAVAAKVRALLASPGDGGQL
jgi:mRNA interferase MazF